MFRAIYGLILISAVAAPGSAQETRYEAAKFDAAPPAELFKVEEGIFALDLNQSIDITDKKVLLTLIKTKNCLGVSLAGNRGCISNGDRINLLNSNQPYYIGRIIKDRQECFLDVYKIEDVAGADPRVSFRLHCV